MEFELDDGDHWVIPHPPDSVERVNQTRTGRSQPLRKSSFSTKADIIEMFRLNMELVNDAFVGTPFIFSFVEEKTTLTQNNTWAEEVAKYEIEVGAAVGSGDLKVLDPHSCHFPSRFHSFFH